MALEQWADLVPEKKYKLSEESARKELSRLLNFYETDLSDVPAESETAINQILSRLLSAIRQGKIELQEDDKEGSLFIIQHLKNGETLKYRELRGSDRTKLESATDPVRRMHLLVGILSGYGSDAVGKLPAGDLKYAESLAAYFLTLA